MKKHPLSHEQFLEQIERNRRASELQGKSLPQKEKRRTLSPMMKELLSNPVTYSKKETDEDERLKAIIDG